MVIGVASVLAAHLPQSNDVTSPWFWARRGLDLVAQNYKNAANAPSR
jgi:hypothetical protein